MSSDFVFNVLRTLKTSSIAAIVERLRPLLHIDPVSVLPPEITSEIFSYLTPSMLLEASRASKAWRESTLDGRLWKQKFNLEGWGLDMEAVRNFEQKYNFSRMNRLQRATIQVDQQRQNKRPRAEVDGPEEEISSRQSRDTSNSGIWNDGHDSKEEDLEAASTLFNSKSTQDEVMLDAIQDTVKAVHSRRLSNPTDGPWLSRSNGEGIFKEKNEKPQSADKHRSLGSNSEMEREEEPSQDQEMMIHTASGHSRLNYHYVFKQKRKLEDNWNAGSYKSFQLPHRNYPEEAHSECVYTIQYIGKYLVSGSRDRTLRIWDLDTQRLVRKPLIGHTASVLCLQFDNREDEDIIISGSSDTDVILWRFSTGKMLRKIPQAHRESVLNLKFDHRFLVTCSKDKTIKIWSRHELRPGDRDYPVRGVQNGGKCPAYILDLGGHGGSINDMDTFLTPEQRKPLKPYTPLMLIDSHGAAVNAIHIYHDQLVSASGDRYVKVFDIHTGVCTAICRGHTKGIACVQYDGKRIVSGSSDNTIRIYDPATQAEVACLQGHNRLVRTIQSAFGDFPDSSREQLEMEANEIDQQYYDAQRAGTLATRSTQNRGRNAGSKQPKDIMAVGAKLPPGGGGSRWGRIISGSYDETIIVWKKAPDGRWVMGHRLRQEEALRAAGGPLLSQSDMQPQLQNATLQHGQGNNQQTIHTHPSQPQMNVQGWQNPIAAPQLMQQAMQTGVAAVQAGLHGTAYIPNAANPHLLAYQQLIQQQLTRSTTSGTPPATSAVNTAPPLSTQSTSPTTSALPQYQQQPLGGLSTAAQTGTQQATQTPAAPQPPVANAAISQPNARVFKLQFDARRIICCSQDPKIVGWDFANDDKRIIECSRFFDTPQ